MPVSDEAAKDVGRGEGRVCGTCCSEIKSLSPPSNIFKDTYIERWASQVVLVVRNTPSNAGNVGLIPGSERLPWRRAWRPTPGFLPIEESGGLQSMGPQRAGDD